MNQVGPPVLNLISNMENIFKQINIFEVVSSIIEI